MTSSVGSIMWQNWPWNTRTAKIPKPHAATQFQLRVGHWIRKDGESRDRSELKPLIPNISTTLNFDLSQVEFRFEYKAIQWEYTKERNKFLIATKTLHHPTTAMDFWLYMHI